MRHWILTALLAPALAHASPASLTPNATQGGALSSAGPMAPAPAKPAAKAGTRALLGSGPGASTYTYLRCWYRQSSDPLRPKSDYVWATDPASGSYYRVYGNWWADGVFEWKNMFYSATSQDELRSVCQNTLKAKGIAGPLSQVFAANNQLSYNYTVWTNDKPTQGTSINKLIAFGDSLSDTQNMYNASQWKLPNGSSWYNGRFSNDKVWVEYLAENLKLPLYNWAIGGSAVDTHLVVPGLIQQVQSWVEYMQRAPDYRVENTLFTVLIGGNDLVNYGKTVDQVLAGERQALDLMISKGARHILLVNLPDVSRAPVFRFPGKDGAKVAAQVRDYNARLPLLMDELRQKYGSTLNLRLFDSYAMFNDLLTNPGKYAVDNTVDSCLNINADSSLNYTLAQSPRPACTNPDRYVFWDTLHPTTHTHKLLAQYSGELARQAFPLVTLR